MRDTLVRNPQFGMGRCVCVPYTSRGSPMFGVLPTVARPLGWRLVAVNRRQLALNRMAVIGWRVHC